MDTKKMSGYFITADEYAAAGVLHQVTGYLKAKKSRGQIVAIDEVLEYIDKALTEEKELLNAKQK